MGNLQVMGICWCKDKAPEQEVYARSALHGHAVVRSATEPPRVPAPSRVSCRKVDQLVLEMLTLIASFVDK